MAEAATCYRHPDRETGLSCSECGRPICVDCMSVAPVGIRCPDHAGAAQQKKPRSSAASARQQVVQPVRFKHGTQIVTTILIGLNVVIYLAELVGGGTINGVNNWIFDHGALVVRAAYSDGTPAGLAAGEWWRLLTAAFLHYGPIHLGMNMLALWWLGGPVEQALGHWRFLLVYIVSGLAGSAGALIWTPNAITVGASGAIFGMLGAGLILEYRATGRLGGNYLTLIIVNLAFTFALSSNISVGGHIGGLIAGILCTLAITQFGRFRPAFSGPGAAQTGLLLAVGIGSVLVAYWRVRGLA